ncbi:Retrovirus-related Pol polyprotein type-2 like protein [Argiope bruennichi]|uniref:Retrovirus-related Pol polyprotein type-2 like protein n=1 Tax=Argiope bruennichi TaxID=94029 RepID=A0A8T0FXK5_ARGBR|nr:Retrovirus-related Pol polyprotein type-2 like protein [Argiope bruennichi]
MAFLLKDSPECAKSKLNLFTLPPTQTVIEKGHWVKFHPISNASDGGPIEFLISGSGEEYLDLSQILLQVKAVLYYTDTAGRFNIFDQVSATANKGFNKRATLFKNSATVDMIERPHVDIFNQDRFLLNLVDLKIKLIRRVLTGHAKALENATAKYPIDKRQMPKRLVLACIDNDAFNGNPKKSPFQFKHYDVNFVGVYMDGQPMAHQPLELDFEKGNFTRAYQNLFLNSEGWTDPDIHRLADAEARIVQKSYSSKVTNINLTLHNLFPSRTLESIKSRRKNAAYKKLVEEKLLLLTSGPACPPPSAPAASPVHVAPAPAVLPEVPVKLPVPVPDCDVGPVVVADEPPASKIEPADQPSIADDPWNLHEETLVVGSSLYYLDDLNSDLSLRPQPSEEEINILDKAFLQIFVDQASAKSLLVSYLTTVLSPSHLGDKPSTRTFWSHLFTKSSPQNFASSISCFGPPSDTEIDSNLLVYPAEVLAARLPLKSSSGPDGVSVRTLSRIPVGVLCKVYSAFLLLRWVPGFLLDSRTIFIPKKHDSAAPSQLRPLSIASVVVRQFHKILATRLMSQVDPSFDDLQFGFRPKDGIASAVHLLDDLLQDTCRRLSSISLAVLDMEKAFDSVSHDAIFDALAARQVSPTLVEPTRGVRQGDPLSPLLFLLVFEEVLKSIPVFEGYVLHGRINHIAYADDLVLVADSISGLNNIANKILPALHASGLNISVEKSSTLSWKADGKNKRVIFNSKSTLLVRNRPVRSFRADENFKYLGVNFTPRGRVKFKTDLDERLNILAKSLLKPQQKFFFLVKHLLKSLYHQLTFAKLYSGMLKKLDVSVRKFVRSILHLPKDVPVAAFHANTCDGGLGVPSLRWIAPLLAANRGSKCHPALLQYDGRPIRTTKSARCSRRNYTCNVTVGALPKHLRSLVPIRGSRMGHLSCLLGTTSPVYTSALVSSTAEQEWPEVVIKTTCVPGAVAIQKHLVTLFKPATRLMVQGSSATMPYVNISPVSLVIADVPYTRNPSSNHRWGFKTRTLLYTHRNVSWYWMYKLSMTSTTRAFVHI